MSDAMSRREHTIAERNLSRFCQLSRYRGQRTLVSWWDSGYAAAIIPIKWANRSRWMSRPNMARTSFTSVRNEADLTRDVMSLLHIMGALPG
jgi:hypothetical protein